jgi:hypothetical protein
MLKGGVRLDAKEMKNATERIQVLEAYLDEVGVCVCVCVCMCVFCLMLLRGKKG